MNVWEIILIGIGLSMDAFAVSVVKGLQMRRLHFGRLFAAGNMLKPSRLYWSKTPGGDRTIDDWRSDPASENVSGGFVDVGIGNDPITGLFPLSNQLIIFTRNSMYRLLGDRPSNFRVLAVDAAVGMPAHMACLRYADRLYFMTDSGLCCYDGQTVRRPQNAAAMAPLLKASYLECMASAACDDKLYFAFRTSASETYCDRMIEYDLLRDRCMLRSGFHLVDLATASGKLYALTDAGRPVCFDESDSYDGDPIDAWWVTPCMDLGHKEAVKTLLSLTATGSGSASGPSRTCRPISAASTNSVAMTACAIPITTAARPVLRS